MIEGYFTLFVIVAALSLFGMIVSLPSYKLSKNRGYDMLSKSEWGAVCKYSFILFLLSPVWPVLIIIAIGYFFAQVMGVIKEVSQTSK